MSLAEKVQDVGRRFSSLAKGVGLKTMVYSAGLAGLLYSPTMTRAEDYRTIQGDTPANKVVTVDNTWDLPYDVNTVLDNDPATLGPNGETDLLPGDQLIFSAGEFVLPPVNQLRFEVYVPGVQSETFVDINGNGYWDIGEPYTDTNVNLRYDGPVIIRGIDQWSSTLKAHPDTTSATIMRVNSSSYVHVYDLGFDDARNGIFFSGENARNNLVKRVNFSNLDKGTGCDNYYNVDNTEPALIVDECNFSNIGSNGLNYNEDSEPEVTTQSNFAVVQNSTFTNIGALVIDATFVNLGGAGGDCNWIVLGEDMMDGNVIYDSDGATFYPFLYCGFPDSPDYNGEWQVQGSESLASQGIGVGNFEADPILTWSSRPTWNSPSWYPENEKVARKYSGAFPSSGDFDGDGFVTWSDTTNFYALFNNVGQNVEVNSHVARVYDVDGDGIIACNDRGNLINAYQRSDDFGNDIQVDTDNSGTVDVVDLLTVLSDWGGSGQGDVNNSGETNVQDLLLLLSNWGPNIGNWTQCDG